ncbi:MAG TPA: DNA repair exonuclease [Longimicrobiaceae bacterium]
MKILCTADVHIGRRPTRLPGRVDTSAHSCARAWSNLVDCAIAEGVQLVLVAGDLVDQANRYYEAAGPVEAGVRALVSHGIGTVAVAGNHDHNTLPWVASRFRRDEFRLLGQQGRWERHTVERDGRPVLHIDGWSFPAAVFLDDPLQPYPRRPRDGVPVIGLLHADLDQPNSRHAPVSLAALRAAPVDFWLLGHIHRSALRQHAGGAALLYPGSPQAMDPGEPGVHGPWIVEIDSGGRFHARMLPLSTVRYDSIEVDVAGADEEAEVDRRVVASVHSALAAVEPEAGPLQYLSLRVRLTGRTPLHRRLQRRNWEEVGDLDARSGEMRAGVERLEIATRPARDLDELAHGQDAPALLARLIRNLDKGTLAPTEEELVRTAVAQVEEVWKARQYLPLQEEDDERPSEARVRELLGQQAMFLLDELLASREGA